MLSNEEQRFHSELSTIKDEVARAAGGNRRPPGVVQHLPTRSVSRFRQRTTATHFHASRTERPLAAGRLNGLSAPVFASDQTRFWEFEAISASGGRDRFGGLTHEYA